MKKDNIFRRFGRWIKKQFEDPIKLKKDVTYIVEVLRFVRQGLDKPFTKAITDLIPGSTDEAVITAVKLALDKVLGVVDAWKQLPKVLPQNEPLKNAAIAKTGSVALQNLHGIPEVEADTMIQEAYNRTKGF